MERKPIRITRPDLLLKSLDTWNADAHEPGRGLVELVTRLEEYKSTDEFFRGDRHGPKKIPGIGDDIAHWAAEHAASDHKNQVVWMAAAVRALGYESEYAIVLKKLPALESNENQDKIKAAVTQMLTPEVKVLRENIIRRQPDYAPAQPAGPSLAALKERQEAFSRMAATQPHRYAESIVKQVSRGDDGAQMIRAQKPEDISRAAEILIRHENVDLAADMVLAVAKTRGASAVLSGLSELSVGTVVTNLRNRHVPGAPEAVGKAYDAATRPLRHVSEAPVAQRPRAPGMA